MLELAPVNTLLPSLAVLAFINTGHCRNTTQHSRVGRKGLYMIELCQLGTVSSPPSTESRTSILKKKQVGQWWCTPNPNTQEAGEGGGSLSSNLVYREHALY